MTVNWNLAGLKPVKARIPAWASWSSTFFRNRNILPYAFILIPLLQMAAYLNSPTVELNTCPLQWWNNYGQTGFPLLTVLARRALSTPGTSAIIERTWSTGRRMLRFNQAPSRCNISLNAIVLAGFFSRRGNSALLDKESIATKNKNHFVETDPDCLVRVVGWGE